MLPKNTTRPGMKVVCKNFYSSDERAYVVFNGVYTFEEWHPDTIHHRNWFRLEGCTRWFRTENFDLLGGEDAVEKHD